MARLPPVKFLEEYAKRLGDDEQTKHKSKIDLETLAELLKLICSASLLESLKDDGDVEEEDEPERLGLLESVQSHFDNELYERDANRPRANAGYAPDLDDETIYFLEHVTGGQDVKAIAGMTRAEAIDNYKRYCKDAIENRQSVDGKFVTTYEPPEGQMSPDIDRLKTLVAEKDARKPRTYQEYLINRGGNGQTY